MGLLEHIETHEPHRLRFPFPNRKLDQAEASRMAGNHKRLQQLIVDFPDVINIQRVGRSNNAQKWFDLYEIQTALELDRIKRLNQ